MLFHGKGNFSEWRDDDAGVRIDFGIKKSYTSKRNAQIGPKLKALVISSHCSWSLYQ